MSGASTPRIVMAGGGTGGHLYPGVAVARALLDRAPSATVTFAGTRGGLETRLVPREGFELDTIRSRGLSGKSPGRVLAGLATLPLSAIDAWRTLSRRRPDLVIGLGGYSSGPMVLLAALRRVPTMLMEQNAVPGVTNRLLARVVRAAAVTYPETLGYFGDIGFVSGNPVRPEFLAASEPMRSEHDDRIRVLVFGGSQGAHALNAALQEAARELASLGANIELTHQTGDRDLEMVRSAYRAAGVTARVEPFLHEMSTEMRRADLVVCRAGASTLAELAVVGRAAMLVPLPWATHDHQRHNARVLAEAGAAEVMDQEALTGPALVTRLAELSRDRGRLERMGRAMRRFAREDAAAVIADRALAILTPTSDQ